MEAINLPKVSPGEPVLASHMNAVRDGLMGLGVVTDSGDVQQVSTPLGTLMSPIPPVSNPEAFGEDVRVRHWVTYATDRAYKDGYDGASSADDGKYACVAIWLGTSIAKAKNELGIGSEEKLCALDIDKYSSESSKGALPAQEILEKHFKPNGDKQWNDGYVRLPIRTLHEGLFGYRVSYKSGETESDKKKAFIFANSGDWSMVSKNLKDALEMSDATAEESIQFCTADDDIAKQSRVVNIATGGGGGTVVTKSVYPFELGDITSHTEGETTVTTRAITHRIWQEGSITRHAKDTEVEWSPGGKTPSEGNPLYLVLVRQFGEEGDVFEFLLQSELESQQVMNPANYYVPLYELDADLNVVCDLRPMPRLQVYDVQY